MCSTRADWRRRWSSPEDFSRRWRRACSMRAFISAAAASVKVTTRSWLTLQRGLASQTRWTQRSARTEVLPEPAAAETRRLVPVVVIARSCSGVHLRAAAAAAAALLDDIGRLLHDALEDLFAADVLDVVVVVEGRVEAADAPVRAVGTGRDGAHAVGLEVDDTGHDAVGGLRDEFADSVE